MKHIKINPSFFIKPLACETLTFIFMYILGSICILTTYNNLYTNGIIKLHGELFFDVYILTFLIASLPPRIRKISKWIILSLLYIIAIADVFCFIRFGTGISANIIQLIIETNQQESIEFYRSYITLDILKTPVCGIIFLFLSHIVLDISSTRNCFKLTSNTGYIIIILVVVCGILSIKRITNQFKLFTIKSNSGLVDFFTADTNRSRTSYLPLYRFLSALHINSIERAQTKLFIENFGKTTIDTCLYTSSNIIIIIGESFNKHHSSIYGYKIPTTPFQEQEVSNGKMFVFNDAVTPYNLTSEVFKNIFSLNDCTIKQEWYETPLFTQILKNAGYNVTFISNQFQPKNLNDFSAGTFIDNIQISHLQFSHRNNHLHEFDASLLIEYDSLRNYNKDNNLIIFHLIGQHVTYANRFPQNSKIFTQTDYLRQDLSQDDLAIVTDYDNATRYNDEVIKQIVNTFSATNSIILFLSDHGEECYDEIKTFGRSHTSQIDKNIAKNEFEIPFWIWCSEEYQTEHPDIISAIKSSQNLPFFSSDIGHLIISLAGVKCQYYKAENNILDKKYNKHRKRLLKGIISYETLMAN